MAGSSSITPIPPDKIEDSHVWRDWLFKLSKLAQSTRTDIAPSAITVPASGTGYQNANRYPVLVQYAGGTGVTLVEISRTPPTYYSVDSSATTIAAGSVYLSSNDWIRFTYATVPTVTFIPL